MKSRSTSELNNKVRRASRSSSLASSYKNTKKKSESSDCLNIEQEEPVELDHNGIFIKHVYEHSNAYGKLKYAAFLLHHDLDLNIFMLIFHQLKVSRPAH